MRHGMERRLVMAAVVTGAVGLALFAWLPARAKPKGPVPLKVAKFIIEHNATDHDTGFQAFIDSEGWDQLELVGPNGPCLRFEGRGALGELGLTELFFETVEPENADKPIEELFAEVPAGTYTFKGREMIDGESSGETVGAATLTHDIPAGPVLRWPTVGAKVPATDFVARWDAVTQTLRGTPAKIIGYQLIIEKDATPHPHMIGKWGLSMYLPASTTSMPIPPGFFEPRTKYLWEVLAIEQSGNQTLSSGEFSTE